MSAGPNGEDTVELSCSVGELKVSLRGPASRATALLQRILNLGESHSDDSPSASIGSFDLISSRPADFPRTSTTRTLETRAQIERSFAVFPKVLLLVTGSSVSGLDRVKRTWKAGQWGVAVMAGRVGSPNRSPQLDLRPRFYAILRTDRLAKPTLCTTAAAYWRIIGDLANSDSISHSFPSELEARTYLAGAEIYEFDTVA